jgi:hypothetical protein
MFLIGVAVAAVLILQVQTLKLIKKLSMITADEVTQLVNALTTALQAEANDATALAAAQQQVSDLTAQNAALNDPALQTTVTNALAAAAAANPAPAPTPTPSA